MNKEAVLAQIRAEKIVGLVRADVGDDLSHCAKALADGGVHALEVAMTTPAAVRILEKAHAALPDFIFGLGTVLDVETARAGILAGARFIVTPALRPDVITLCRRYNVAVISGAYSPDDIAAAHLAGTDASKVYPGELFGPAYLTALRAKAPAATLIPIGGVTPETLPEFLRAGAAAVFAGASLLDEAALRERDWTNLSRRARAFSAAAATPLTVS